MRHTALSCFSAVKAARSRSAEACRLLLVNRFHMHRLSLDYFFLSFFLYGLPARTKSYVSELLQRCFISALDGRLVLLFPAYCLKFGLSHLTSNCSSALLSKLCVSPKFLLRLLASLMLVNLIWDYCSPMTIICPAGRCFLTITAGLFFLHNCTVYICMHTQTYKWMEPKQKNI